MASFPFGIVLVILCLGTLAWGVACAVIGGIVRMNIAQYVNDYIADLDAKGYMVKSENMIYMKESYEEADLGHAAKTIGVMAIIVGVLAIVYSLIGMAAGMLKNMTLLFVLIGCILICTMLQFVTIWMIMDVNSSFHDSAKDDLVEKLVNEYDLGQDVSQWTMVMNSIMLAGQCCGIKGPADFPNMTYQYANGMSQYMDVSPACCKAVVWEGGRDALIKCGINKNDKHHTDGCYNTVFNDAYDAKMGAYMLILFLVAAWECVIMAVGVLMLFNPPDDDGGKGAGRGPAADQRQDASAPETELKMPILTGSNPPKFGRERVTPCWTTRYEDYDKIDRDRVIGWGIANLLVGSRYDVHRTPAQRELSFFILILYMIEVPSTELEVSKVKYNGTFYLRHDCNRHELLLKSQTLLLMLCVVSTLSV